MRLRQIYYGHYKNDKPLKRNVLKVLTGEYFPIIFISAFSKNLCATSLLSTKRRAFESINMSTLESILIARIRLVQSIIIVWSQLETVGTRYFTFGNLDTNKH